MTQDFDKIGQLAVADSSVNSEDRGYTYDSAWNLNYLTNNGSLGAFAVDGKNQLTSDPSCALDQYDSNGNLTTRYRNLDGNLLHLLTLAYDDENRLVLATGYTNGVDCTVYDEIPSWRSEFIYDGLSRLRRRVDYILDLNYQSCTYLQFIPIAETRYAYDGMQVIQERDGYDVPTVSYTRGSDLSGTFEGAGGIGGLLARTYGYNGSTGVWTNHQCYFADGNGNITALVDEDQDLVALYRYDPFGNTISQAGIFADANVYRFSSKEVHASSGMYYYGFRFYDPR